jgi:hypothetical protein
VYILGLGGRGGRARGWTNDSLLYRQLFHMVIDQICEFDLRGTDNAIDMRSRFQFLQVDIRQCCIGHDLIENT